MWINIHMMPNKAKKHLSIIFLHSKKCSRFKARDLWTSIQSRLIIILAEKKTLVTIIRLLVGYRQFNFII
jgi:hypothetical protein